MKLLFSAILTSIFVTNISFAEEVLPTVEVYEKDEEAFSEFWKENKGAQIFSGKKNTITDLKKIPQLQTNNYRQATSQTPGLLISEVPNESIAAMTFRGLGDPHESFNVLLLQDGIPVSADMFGYPAHYYSPALPMMDRFQFIRGGSALQYGPQPGGVVNYISRPLTKDQPQAASVGLTGGSYNLLTTNNSLYGSKGDQAYGIEYHRRQGDGRQRKNSDFFADYVQIRNHIFKGKNTYKISFNGYDSDHGNSGGFSKTDGVNANRFGKDQGKATREHDRLKVSRAQLDLGVDRKIDDTSLLEFHIWGSAYKRYSKAQNGGGFGTTPTGTENTIVNQDYYGYNSQLRYLKNYSALGNDHTFTAGYMSYNVDSPLTNATGDDVNSNHGVVTRRINRGTRTNSLYAENRFAAGRWMITPGLRVENIRQVNRERKSPTNTKRKKDFTETIPLLGLGVTYSLSDDSQIYANTSEAYKPLTWSDSLANNPTDTVAEDIESAKILNHELGYRGQTKLVNWDVSLFHIRYENKTGRVGGVLRNTGAGTHRGADLASELKLSQIFQSLKPLGDFNFYANLSVLDARFTRGDLKDKTPQYAPKTISRAGLIYTKENQLKVALMGVVVGRHYGDDGNTSNFEIPSYTVFDLTADWSLTSQWTLSAGINNLLDKQYFSRVRSDGIAWALDRNFYAGASYQF
jgi:Fe(3+) dicitrate transport protein